MNNFRVWNGKEVNDMEGAAIVPGILFLAGIAAIFISGGSMTFLVAGDAAVFLAGIAFMKVLK